MVQTIWNPESAYETRRADPRNFAPVPRRAEKFVCSSLIFITTGQRVSAVSTQHPPAGPSFSRLRSSLPANVARAVRQALTASAKVSVHTLNPASTKYDVGRTQVSAYHSANTPRQPQGFPPFQPRLSRPARLSRPGTGFTLESYSGGSYGTPVLHLAFKKASISTSN